MIDMFYNYQFIISGNMNSYFDIDFLSYGTDPYTQVGLLRWRRSTHNITINIVDHKSKGTTKHVLPPGMKTLSIGIFKISRRQCLPQVIYILLSNARTRASNNFFAFPTLSENWTLNPSFIGVWSLTAGNMKPEFKRRWEL